jgi:hypothetical protein
VWLVRRLWRVAPSAGTLWRSAAVCLLAYTSAAALPAPGLLLLVKLAGVGVVSAGVFVALGEFDTGELRTARSMIGQAARHKVAAADGTT